MKPANVVDLEDIRMFDIYARHTPKGLEVTMQDVSVEDVLEAIGEDTVREYFNIEESA